MMTLYSLLLSSNSNCIDVGSHYGKYLEAFCRLAPHGSHLAIEPLPEYAKTLRSNFPSASVYELALGADSGHIEFHRVVNLEGWSGLKLSSYPGKYETEVLNVQISTLDGLLADDYKPDLIKIDVEGAELDVLKGGINTLTKHRPYIVFEHFVNAYRPYGITPADIYNLLCCKLDYRIFTIDGVGPLSQAEFTQLADMRVCWNFVAHS
jgi:FkbM family methyltransferase